MDDIEETTTKEVNYDWQQGDDPETHPMWDIEVDLERGMMEAGAKALRNRVLKAQDKDRMTDLREVRALADSWVPGVADSIKTWVRDVEKSKGGPKPIAYRLVKELDPYLAAMVGVRAILNHMAKVTMTLANLAFDIGKMLEHEQKIRVWEKESPALYHSLQRDMDLKKVTTDHRRRTNINLFHKHLKKGEPLEHIRWDNWTQDETFRVGWTIMDCIIKQTGWFEVTDDPTHIPRKGKYPKLALVVKDGLSDWLSRTLDKSSVSQPMFRPTVMPPKRWTNTRDGGYYTPYVKSPRFIRFKASSAHQKTHAADEYDAMDFPKVYRAVNLLQETPWCINKRVLQAAKVIWGEKGAIIKGMPELFERELPPRSKRMHDHRELNGIARAFGLEQTPPDPDTAKEIAAWKRQASPIYAFNAKRIGRKRLTDDMLGVAEAYADYPEIYFPHKIDFRGRMYPIPSFLNPQGNDLARGLLTFATSAPITSANGGVRWLAIHLASVWGHDKLPYDKRVAWVYENEILFRLIAEDPDFNRDWCRADKPFQALAAVYEWVDYLNHGEGFESSLPVMVDGTCNGIQHLSALTRDPIAGAYVNLVPASEPQDIYKFVALRLQGVLEALLGSGLPNERLARWWLDACEGELPRTLTKRQVMVLPYGGTKDSFFGYTREWLNEYRPKLVEGLSDEGKEHIKDCVVFLASEMWKVVNEVVSGGMRVMKWLQDCAKQAATEDQPIYWKVPSGFIVRQFYGQSQQKTVKLLLDGTRVEIQLDERTNKLSVREQAQGVAPNFTHSLDACCLTLCCNACEDEGILSFASVHDAYGTHAANMNRLAELLREAFVETHEHDLLGAFRNGVREVMIAPMITKKGMDPMEALEKADDILDNKAGRLEMGNLDLETVLKSQYFFA